MAKRRNPSTSNQAHISMIPVIPSHHQKILDALQKNGEGIYEEIAGWCGFSDKNMISRRLLELLNLGKIEKTERTKNTSSGRKAFIYCLKPQKTAIDLLNDWLTDGTEVLDGEKWLGVKDDAPKTEKNQVIQQSLFK